MVTLSELVVMHMPDEMVMELPKAVLPLLPSIGTAPSYVLPSCAGSYSMRHDASFKTYAQDMAVNASAELDVDFLSLSG